MLNTIKNAIKLHLEQIIKEEYANDVNVVVEEPKKVELGDISVPVFTIVRVLRQPLPQVAKKVTEWLKTCQYYDYFSKIESVSGFINISLNKEKYAELVIEEYNESMDYGKNDIGAGKTICIDYSSPNIAKPFSIGHLRSTIIGHSLGNIMEKCGYKVVRINHLGDFGTQFGKIIYAYLNYGDKEKVKENPIEELVKLYVKFHEEAKDHPEIEDKAREIFKDLEQGNEKYNELWNYFRKESLKEYMKVYKMLDVDFDSYNGEAFYNDKMQAVVDELTEKHLLKKDQGAMIVDLGEEFPPALIQKSDGSTLYITRDLAALFYRKNTYDFDEALYVVGNEQKLHFQQLRKVVELMGYHFAEDIHHINFGLVLQNGKKMSTRKGKVVKLVDVLNEASRLSLDYINEKSPGLLNKAETAQKIGVSAIIFNDLKNFRGNDFEFNLEEMVNFSGQTGPYLQYTSVRITSILNTTKALTEKINYELFKDDIFFDLIKSISIYEDIIIKTKEEYSPSTLAKYLLNLASQFNSFYAKEKVLVEDLVEMSTKLKLIEMVRTILNDGMKLLGMQVIEKM